MQSAKCKIKKAAGSLWQIADSEEMGKEVKTILSKIVEKLKSEYKSYSPFYAKRHSFV